MKTMYTVSVGTTPTENVIKKAVEYHQKQLKTLDNLQRYYEGNHPILARQKKSRYKNNKLVINHAEYITDTFVNYLLGNPVEYKIEHKDKEKEVDGTLIFDEYDKQEIADLDLELGTDVSIYGRAYEYIYANEENEVRSGRISPKNCVIVYDDTMNHNKLFALIYDKAEEGSTIKQTESGYEQEIKIKNLRVVTDSEVLTFTDDLKDNESEEHSFGKVPVIEYRNNSYSKGDFQSVLSLIDAYNTIQSDRVNDKEQLVEAVLVLYGFTLTDEILAKLKESRVLQAPKKKDGTSAEYLEKSLDETGIEMLRKVIEQDIHKISKTPNMSDDNFVGNASGVAIKYKLLPFEWATNAKERYFTKGLKERLYLYSKYLNTLDKKQSLVEPHIVTTVFKRSLPQNDFETSQMANNLLDMVSRKTLLSQLSFVEDAGLEVNKYNEERDARVKQLSPQFASGFANESEEEDE